YVPESEKRAARVARWRGRLTAPDFSTLGAHLHFREAIAEATLEGELLPPVAAVGLKAVHDASDHLYREKTGLVAGASGFVIERGVFPARGLPRPAWPASSAEPHDATGNGAPAPSAAAPEEADAVPAEELIEVERFRRLTMPAEASAGQDSRPRP